MENPYLQVIIISVFLAVLGLCSYFVTQLEEKQLLDMMVKKNSYALDYNDDAQNLYGGFADPVDVVFTDMSNMYRNKVQEEALGIVTDMIESDYSLNTAQIPRAALEQFWLLPYRQWVIQQEQQSSNVDFETTFCNSTSSTAEFSACVKEFLDTSIFSNFAEFLNFDEQEAVLVGFRFSFQAMRVYEPFEYPDVLQGLQEALDTSAAPTSLANSTHLSGDTTIHGTSNDLLYDWTIQSLGTAVLGCAVLFFLFLSLDEAFVALLVSVCILTYTMGFVSIVGIPIDYVAQVVFSMIAGFLVDYVAHISEVFTRAHARGEHRISHILPEVLQPLVLGGTTTVLGVLPILMSPSPGYHAFTKICTITVLSGVSISIFVLPVIYSRKPSCASTTITTKENNTKNDEPEMAIQNPNRAEF